MEYDKLKFILANYNWNHGFDIPKKILNEKTCDLALALEIFYLCDGYAYFLNGKTGSSEWLEFISNLYIEIVNGKYQLSQYHYEIPLNFMQKDHLRKNGVPNVFLKDV